MLEFKLKLCFGNLEIQTRKPNSGEYYYLKQSINITNEVSFESHEETLRFSIASKHKHYWIEGFLKKHLKKNNNLENG